MQKNVEAACAPVRWRLLLLCRRSGLWLDTFRRGGPRCGEAVGLGGTADGSESRAAEQEEATTAANEHKRNEHGEAHAASGRRALPHGVDGRTDWCPAREPSTVVMSAPNQGRKGHRTAPFRTRSLRAALLTSRLPHRKVFGHTSDDGARLIMCGWSFVGRLQAGWGVMLSRDGKLRKPARKR